MLHRKFFCYKQVLLRLVVLIVFVSPAFGQAGDVIAIEGKILDESSGDAIPYANIGVVNSPVGTMSDSSGYFNLVLYKEDISSTVRVSSMGFKDTLISLKDLKQTDNNNILLEKAFISLDTVIVNSILAKKAVLGKLKYRSSVAAHLIPLDRKLSRRRCCYPILRAEKWGSFSNCLTKLKRPK